MDYILATLATILLAGQISINKLFQKENGDGFRTGILFNLVNGIITAVFFFCLNGFHLHVSLYSAIMATVMTVCATAYLIISFRIMAIGSVASYSLFLMLGGMVVPYLYGVLALGESLTVLRTVGLLLICASLVLIGRKSGKSSVRAGILYGVVFLLNGLVSVVSKLHQIDTIHHAVDTADFIILTGLSKTVLLAILLPFLKKPESGSSRQVTRAFVVIALSSIVGGVSYMLQLIGAKTLPATVLYPIVTGGTVVFCALMGDLFFRGKAGSAQPGGHCMLLYGHAVLSVASGCAFGRASSIF